jgi:diguanylate cyclase (GGDEF)-like protein/PAS domain S-box-containing protein
VKLVLIDYLMHDHQGMAEFEHPTQVFSMSEKPTYEELEQRILELEKAGFKRNQVEDSLQKVIERANAILESISDAIFSLDNDLVVTYFNKAAERILCRKSQEVLGRYLFDVFPEGRGSVFDEKYCQAIQEKIPLFFETFFAVDPYRDWYDVRVYPQPEGISVYFQVVTERKQAREEIQNLAKFPSENPNPVIRLRQDGLLLYANEASKIIIQDWNCQIRNYAPSFWCDLVMDAIRNQSKRMVDVHLDDRIYAFDISPIPNTNYANIYGRDVTEGKKAEEKIQQMAFYDFLTGLPNRRLFTDRLGIALHLAKRNKNKVGIVMLDLDTFKEVNDTHGHDIGDILLKAAAERLSETLRKGDTVARFGGDEFVLIFPEMDIIEDMIQIVHKIIDSFHKPFLIDTHQLFITTSIGIAIYPNDGIDERNLLKNADIAMYQAKKAGRARYQFYGTAII